MSATPNKSKPPSRRRSLSSQRTLFGYLFVSPFLLGYLLFFLSPLVFYVAMAFSKFQFQEGRAVMFTPVGLENFRQIFTKDLSFVEEMGKSLADVGVSLVSIVLYSLFVAILLNQKFRGRFFARAVFFLPVVVASGLAAIDGNSDILIARAQQMISGMSGSTGVKMSDNIAQTILQMFGESQAANDFVQFISSIVANMYTITQAAGVQILIFLAGLQTISPSLYEASTIDGATGWENFWKITFPMISPLILVNAVYTVVDNLSGTTNSTVRLLYKTMTVDVNYTQSAAMGVVYFSITILLVALVMFFVSKMVYYETQVDKEGGI